MDISTIGRVPPQNIEAEQSVLGALLIDSEMLPVVTSILKAEDFYREDHRLIYDAVFDLHSRNEPVDLITISDVLRRSGHLDATGGIEYLANIASAVPTTANTGYYIRLVQEKSILRKLIKASNQIAEMGYNAREDVQDILDSSERLIFDILQKRSRNDFTHIKELLVEAMSRLDTLYNNKSNITGVASGFTDLDYKTSGFQNSDFILIAARPGMGKTSLALNIAQYAALHNNVPVAVFSLEMSKSQLANRMLASEVMIDSHKLRTGRLEDNDWESIIKAMEPLSYAPIYIDDTPGASVMEIRAKCRRLKLEKNIGLVIIDYLQLMQGKGKNDNRQQEISEISRSLKILAKEINLPLIALSQLSRAPETRTDHRPVLSDLRESGAIEQDADLVIFIYRDDKYNPQTEKPNVAELIIAKHRNGATGSVELKWIGEYTTFKNL